MKKNKNKMKIIFISSIILMIFFSSLHPIFAQYRNQEKIPGASQQQTEFIPYLKDIINFGFAIIGILALFMLIIGAYQYLMAAGNIGKVESAKETIGSALLGLILGLCAWIILNKINPDLVNFRAITTISSSTTNTNSANNNQPSGDPSANAGKCIEGTGNCAEANMSCFGSDAKNASIVCNAESGGDFRAGGDKCGGTPVSYGLMQMNTSCHNLGLGCEDAFKRTDTGANCCIGSNGCNNSNCQIANSALYDQCKAAMSNTTTNLQAACNLYKTSGWKPWSGASKCGIG
ncbi:MAG: pilin [Candidatus Moraniibacteriota bacterium]